MLNKTSAVLIVMTFICTIIHLDMHIFNNY